MQDCLHDPRLMRLPQPIRVDAASGSPFDTALLANLGILAAVRPYLTDAATPTEWIINHVPGMRQLAMAHFGLPSATHLGVFMLMMTRARLRAHGDPILEVSAPLQALLAQTDVQNGLPVRFFRKPADPVLPGPGPPQPAAGAPSPLRPARVRGRLYTRRTQALGLDPAKPTRAIELLITGSPVGKANVLR